MNRKELLCFWIRNVSSYFLVFCLIASLNFLPLSITTVIFNLQTYFGSFLSWFFLGEPFHRFEVISITISFLAVVLIYSGREEQNEHTTSENLIYFSLPLVSSFLMGVLATVSRYLKNLHPSYSAYWFSVTELFFHIPMDLYQILTGKPFFSFMHKPNWEGYSVEFYFYAILGVGFFLTLGAYAAISAFSRAKTGSVISIV